MNFEAMARFRGEVAKPTQTALEYQTARLHGVLPGGTLRENAGAPPDERWEVVSGKRAKKLSHGSTAAEAVDRAVWLFGRNDT